MAPSRISHRTSSPRPSREAQVETLLRDPADAPEGSARLDLVPADPAPPVKARSTCTGGKNSEVAHRESESRKRKKRRHNAPPLPAAAPERT